MSRRLNGVLRVRQIQEKQARGALGMSRVRHRAAVDAERETWVRLDDLSLRALGESGSLPLIRMLTDAGMLAAETQNRVVVDASAAVDRALGEWTIAARRVEALDRLSERLAVSEAEERQRLAQNEVEDLVLARFAVSLEAGR